jgi:hypothetical protein
MSGMGMDTTDVEVDSAFILRIIETFTCQRANTVLHPPIFLYSLLRLLNHPPLPIRNGST